MAQKVTLDALIPREDFEINESSAPSAMRNTIQVRDLERGAFLYTALRKPDFQRETSEWDPQAICEFVRSFVDGDLIPAIILWRAGDFIFVIDGAHRLSALIAWVQDDYGDGPISKTYFSDVISKEQTKVAERTRNLVKATIGSYADHEIAAQQPDKSPPEMVRRARRLAALGLQVQWVEGDAKKAEASFFKINRQAVPINKTELRLLQSRKKANAIAARAIIRSGTGHKYWSSFEKEKQAEIERIASTIYNIFFVPEMPSPIKTLDLPVGGRGYSSEALPLIFDFVNLCNELKADKDFPEDETGDTTIKMLKQCRSVAERLSGTHPSSLGLHPAVYFYSLTGRYQPTSFLANR